METRHIKIDYADGLNGKKQLLSSEISLIYIAKTLSRYERLRKKEFMLKNELKTAVALLKTRINLFLSTLPDIPNPQGMQKANKREKSQEEKSLSEELEDIQEKLANLQ